MRFLSKNVLCTLTLSTGMVCASAISHAQTSSVTQTTPTNTTRTVTIDTAEVVYASGDDAVLRTPDGRVRLFELVPGTPFTIDGKPATAADLTPGMTISHVKINTKVESEVTTVTQINGTITAKNGPWVTLRLEDGTSKMYRVPAHATFTVDGRTARYAEVTRGMRISATVVRTEEQHTHTTEAAMLGSTPPQSGTLLIEK
jgi:hypothetical protein